MDAAVYDDANAFGLSDDAGAFGSAFAFGGLRALTDLPLRRRTHIPPAIAARIAAPAAQHAHVRHAIHRVHQVAMRYPPRLIGGASGWCDAAGYDYDPNDAAFSFGGLISSISHAVSSVGTAIKSVVQKAAPVLDVIKSVAPLVPGIGTAVGAAIGGAEALAKGERIDQAFIDAVGDAVPGGAIAKAAFDAGKTLIQGGNITDAMLNAARDALPGGAAARAAFDAAVALAHGKSLQDAAIGAATSAINAVAPDVLNKLPGPAGDLIKQAATLALSGKSSSQIAGALMSKALQSGIPSSVVQQLAPAVQQAIAGKGLIDQAQRLALGTVANTASHLNVNSAEAKRIAAQLAARNQGAAAALLAGGQLKSAVGPMAPRAIAGSAGPTREGGGPLPYREGGMLAPHVEGAMVHPTTAIVASALVRSPSLRALPVAQVAQQLAVPQTAVKDAVASLAASANQIGTGQGLVLRAAPTIAQTLPSTVSTDQVLASYGAASAPAVVGPGAGTGVFVPKPSAIAMWIDHIPHAATAPTVVQWTKALGVGTVRTTAGMARMRGADAGAIDRSGLSMSDARSSTRQSAPTSVWYWKNESGDSPWRVAQVVTGDGNRYKELFAANPTKAVSGGNFTSFLVGERIALPTTWNLYIAEDGTPSGGKVLDPPSSVIDLGGDTTPGATTAVGTDTSGTYVASLPAGRVTAIKLELGTWGRTTGKSPNYPTALDVNDTVDEAFVSAVRVFQQWSNASNGTTLRTDGKLDQATVDALDAYNEGLLKSGASTVSSTPGTSTPAPLPALGTTPSTSTPPALPTLPPLGGTPTTSTPSASSTSKGGSAGVAAIALLAVAGLAMSQR